MIREANPDDLRALYDMIEAYYKEYQARMPHKIGFNWTKVASMLYTWLHNDGCVSYIDEHGAIMGEVGEAWFSSDMMANVHWCFVWPEHRNGLLARALIKKFIAESAARGALYVMWDDWSGMTDTRMLAKFLGSVGFQVQGNVHRLTVKENCEHAADDGFHTAYCVDSRAVAGEGARGQ